MVRFHCLHLSVVHVLVSILLLMISSPSGVNSFTCSSDVACLTPQRTCLGAKRTLSQWLSAAPLGDLSAPEAPQIDQKLILAACAKLPWEVALAGNRGSRDNSAESLTRSNNDNWENGSLWARTRIRLVDLWILPRDMSNGADSRYAIAASKSELRMLAQVPQLLRSSTALETAELVLAMGLPPALLRKEPGLMVYPPEYVRGGMKTLQASMSGSSNQQLLQSCRDIPGLFLGAVEKFVEEQGKRHDSVSTT